MFLRAGGGQKSNRFLIQRGGEVVVEIALYLIAVARMAAARARAECEAILPRFNRLIVAIAFLPIGTRIGIGSISRNWFEVAKARQSEILF